MKIIGKNEVLIDIGTTLPNGTFVIGSPDEEFYGDPKEIKEFMKDNEIPDPMRLDMDRLGDLDIMMSMFGSPERDNTPVNCLATIKTFLGLY